MIPLKLYWDKMFEVHTFDEVGDEGQMAFTAVDLYQLYKSWCGTHETGLTTSAAPHPSRKSCKSSKILQIYCPWCLGTVHHHRTIHMPSNALPFQVITTHISQTAQRSIKTTSSTSSPSSTKYHVPVGDYIYGTRNHFNMFLPYTDRFLLVYHTEGLVFQVSIQEVSCSFEFAVKEPFAVGILSSSRDFGKLR